MTKAEKTTWEDFLNEYKKAIDHNEPLEGFIERMSDDGYSVTRQVINSRQILKDSREIATYLNTLWGTNYNIAKFPNITSRPIEQQLKNGYSIETCKRVALMLFRRWKDNSMHVQLRTDVVYGSKFPFYVADLPPLPSPSRSGPVTNNTVPAAAPPNNKPVNKPIRSTPQDNCEFIRQTIHELYVFDQNKGDVWIQEVLTNTVWRHFKNNRLIKASDINENKDSASRFAMEKMEAIKKQNKDKVINEAVEKHYLNNFYRYYILKKIFHQKPLEGWLQLIQPSQIYITEQ